jgi:hypothetical protein
MAQTFCAALAARVKAGYIDPAACVVAHLSSMKSVRKASIVHFAGYSRNYFNDIHAAIGPEVEHWPARQLAIVSVPHCGLGRRFLSAARAKLLLREDPLGTR